MLSAQAARFPEIEAVTLDTAALDTREAALAHAIYDAAVRRWLTLEWLVSRHLNQPFRDVEPALRAVLLVGAAQLALFDRIPVHAAIDEAVEWAKRRIRPGAGGMVNAVLRRVAGDLGERSDNHDDDAGDGTLLPLPDGGARAVACGWPDDPLEAVAVRYSMPAPLLRRWRRSLSRDQVLGVCRHGLTRPPTVLNTRYAADPVPAGWTKPHDADHSVVWTGPHDALGTLLESRTDVWAQDAASAAAIESVDDLQPGVIGDLCAGQGTKTRQLRARFPQATIIATDTDRSRYAVLRSAFESDERVRVLPPRHAIDELRGQADLVLLDVPCSNTGVLGRRVEARYRCTRAALDRLTGIQKQLIADTMPLLSPRGSIVYATCSIEPSENDDIAEWARSWHGLAAERTRRTLPAAPSGPASSVDGSFSTLLRRG